MAILLHISRCRTNSSKTSILPNSSASGTDEHSRMFHKTVSAQVAKPTNTVMTTLADVMEAGKQGKKQDAQDKEQAPGSTKDPMANPDPMPMGPMGPNTAEVPNPNRPPMRPNTMPNQGPLPGSQRMPLFSVTPWGFLGLGGHSLSPVVTVVLFLGLVAYVLWAHRRYSR